VNPVTLLLIRHGQADATGRFCGRLDVPLTVAGQREARAAGDALSPLPVTAVYSSPLRRCRDTAEQIVQQGGLSLPRVRSALAERRFGSWEGVPLDGISDADRSRFWSERGFAPPGGESMAALEGRAGRALGDIADKHQGELVAVVGHGGLFLAALARWLRLDVPSAMRLELSTGRGTLVQCFADGGIRLAATNLPPIAWGEAWESLQS
jgi:probable phosphoglycerate mutase